MPNQVTRARRRRLDNLSRLETDLAESPGALAALAETLERGVPKRSHRGSGSHKKPSKDLWRTKLCSAFEATGACPDGAQCTFAHGAAQLRRRSGVCARVSDDAAAVGPTRWTVHAGEQGGWGAGGAPPSPPALARVDSSDLSTALERVRSITIDEAELTLSPHARAFSMPEPAHAVTPDGSPRLAGFHRSRPPSPPPFSLAPPAKAPRTRGDGRLVGTVVHLSRKLCGTFDTVDEDGVAVTRFNGWYGFVRPDESTLRDEGFCRGDLFLHPYNPQVGDRVSFHLGVHDRRLKAADLRPVSDDSDEDGSATASRSRRDSWDSRDGSPRPGPSRSWDAESSPRRGPSQSWDTDSLLSFA
ncbi:hypothetical protein JL722_1828 [Aureococcus anophagefferens]|nr:hypothetical protein JL722_1828 [Aureococcus anophagefferens]